MRSSRAHRRDPQLKLHKASGRGRVILNGQHHYTKASFGTPESFEEYLGLRVRWRANGREPLRPVQTPAELEQPQTVRELSDAYERHRDAVQAYRKRGRETSERGLVRVALKEFVADLEAFPCVGYAQPRSYGIATACARWTACRSLASTARSGSSSR